MLQGINIGSINGVVDHSLGIFTTSQNGPPNVNMHCPPSFELIVSIIL